GAPMPAVENLLAFRRDLRTDPHRSRTKRILEQYPEVRSLFGNNRCTLLCIVGLAALQIGIAFLIRNYPVWAGVGLGGLVGAAPALGLYFLMHESSHQLVFR